MPSCNSHEGAHGDASYYNTKISNGPTPADGLLSFRQWIEAFAAAPALDTTAFRVHGFSSGGDSMVSECPG